MPRIHGRDSRVRTYDTGVKVLCVTSTPYPYETRATICTSHETSISVTRLISAALLLFATNSVYLFRHRVILNIQLIKRASTPF